MTGTAPFDDDLFERVLVAANPGDVITTLGIARPNWIVCVDREGVDTLPPLHPTAASGSDGESRVHRKQCKQSN